MRLNRLHLTAFGPFTNESLHFPVSSCDLHVIYGPNEAGKSTTLRAVKGLFFGIPGNTTDAYLHAPARLAIGAEIESEGEALSLFRRKGRTATLSDAAGKEVREEVLERLLGGMDEPTFSRRLGLDQVELERGADALMSGSEEGLFAAGTGGADVRLLLSELEKNGEELWKRTGKKPLLNQALVNYGVAKKILTEQIRPSELFENQRKELDAAARELEEASLRRRALRLEEKESSKLLSMLGDLASIRLENEGLNVLGDVVALPAGARAEREQAESRIREILVLRSELARTETKLKERLASLPPRTSLDEAAAELFGLEKRLGSERKAMEDVGKLRARLASYEDDLLAQSRELGLKLSGPSVLDAAFERLPPRTSEDSVRALDTALTTNRATLKGLCEQLQEIWAELAEQAQPADDLGREISALERALMNRAQLRASIATARQLFQIAKTKREQLEALARGYPNLDWDALRLLPEREVLSVGLAEIAERGAELRGLEKLVFEQEDKLSQLRRELDERRQGVPPAREAELLSLRSERDKKFDSLVEGSISREGADAVRVATREADEVSDSLRIHAAAIAKIDAILREEARLGSTCVAARARIQKLEAEIRPCAERLLRPFRAAGLDPTEPLALPRLAELGAQLLAARTALQEAEAAYDSVAAELVAAENVLRSTASGLLPSAHELKLTALLDELEQALQARLQSREASRIQAERCERDRVKARSLELKVSSLRDHLGDIERELTERLERLNLSGELRGEELDAILRGLADLHTKVDAGRDLRRRIEGIERDTRELSADLEALATRYRYSLAGATLVERGERFLAEATRAAENGESRRRTELELQDTLARLEELASEQAKQEYHLVLLAKSARVASPLELPLAEARSEEAHRRRVRLRELEEKVLEASGGESIPELLARARSVTAQALAVRLDEIGIECDSLDGDIRELEAKKSSLEAGLLRFKTVDVADLRQAVSSRAAEARALLHSAMKNELKRLLVSEQMSEFARRFNGPLAERASQLFSTITLGSYDGLEFGLADRSLRCRRGAERLEVANLSRGTCAQLYLSLRLASLELHFSKNPPVPVVFDDLFVDFDDDRATAAFEALAMLAGKTQVLYFTHLSRDLELLSVVTERPNVHRLGVK